MTTQVELQGSQLIVTILTYLVTAQQNYRNVLSIRESRFRMAFGQILGHSRTINLNLATKTFYYLHTNISIKDFLFTQFAYFFRDIIKRMSALVTRNSSCG